MRDCQQAQKWRITAILAVFLTLQSPAIATAETSIWAAGHLANLTTLRRGGVLGPGAQLGLNVGFSEFFAFTADAGASYHFPNAEDEIPGDRVMSLTAGLRYNFDVFKYVPYGGLAAAYYLDAPLVEAAIPRSNFGAKLFLGVDWRFHRFWSVGVRGELHVLLTDLSRYPVYTQVGLAGTYYFRF